MRHGVVPLSDDTATLYALALGASEADAAKLGKRLMAGEATLTTHAEMVDAFGPRGPAARVVEPEMSAAQIVETASAHVRTLRAQGDPQRLIPELLRLILRLGGDVP